VVVENPDDADDQEGKVTGHRHENGKVPANSTDFGNQ